MKRFIIYILLLCGGTAGYLYHRKYGGPEITPWPAITLAAAVAGYSLLWGDFIWPGLRRMVAKIATGFYRDRS